jgi:acetyl-CoA carboxylase biotin carboxyl carrier protein
LSEEAAVKPAKVSQGNERAKETNKEELQKKENIKTITSPMVGTFYSSPSPEAPPFVETGTIVNFMIRRLTPLFPPVRLFPNKKFRF